MGAQPLGQHGLPARPLGAPVLGNCARPRLTRRAAVAVIDPDRPRERAAEEAELRRPDPQVAAEALEPEAGLLADSDPIGFADATMELAAGLARRPLAAGYAAWRLGAELGLAGAATWMRALGLDASGRIAAGARDRRFKDPAWERYPWWFGVQQAYLLWSRS